MWTWLKALRQPGLHFRRQTPFRGYFLDFARHSRRLAIEIDGRCRDGRGDHDARCDAVLAREGYLTLRFTNEAVRDQFPAVMDRIAEVIAERRPTRSLRGHPPHGGEGE